MSTDDTVAIARRHTDHVVVREWPAVEQKNYAATLAANDWILARRGRARHRTGGRHRSSFDAPRMAATGCRVSRFTWAAGSHDRLVSDYQLRLYDRRAAAWTGRYVHESVTVARATVGRLPGELQHFAYRDIADHLETINRYTSYSARQMQEAGRHAGLLRLAGHPPLAFVRNYLLKGGIRDGLPGFIISSMNAYYVFLKFAKLSELQRHRR